MTDHQAETSTATDPPAQRKPRILWANVYCLVDTSSGASMAVREMLVQMALRGYEIAIIGATVFDAPKGVTKLADSLDQARDNRATTRFLHVRDEPLTHKLVITGETARHLMTSEEEGIWYALYVHTLEEFKPDLVYFYGGQPLDMLIADEARYRGIPCAAYLANGNYKGTRWCRDVDIVITDSQATSDYYAEKDQYRPVPVGAFIDPGPVVAPQHSRERLLFINPSLEKGVGVVIQLALLLEQRRPDITIEIVESRGNWPSMLNRVTTTMGTPRDSLANVVVTPNTADMRPLYGRARVLLAPSLWWESSGRILAEAMLNGIPVIATSRGGMPEMIQDAGILINFPPECYQHPYETLPKMEILEPLVEQIIRLYDDNDYYQNFVHRAYHIGQTLHSLEASTSRLQAVLDPLLAQKAGDKEQSPQLSTHKQFRVEEGTLIVE